MRPAEAEVDQFLPRPLGAEASGSPLGCPSGFMAARSSSGENGASLGQGRARWRRARAGHLC